MDSSCGETKKERELRELWQQEHLIRHELEDKARELATKNLEQRLHSLNEIREQINSERGEFVRRDYFEQKYDALSKEIDTGMTALAKDTDTRMKVIENTISNFQGRLWMIGAAITFVVVVVNLLLRLTK